jgi:uncharacterized protein YjbJ (UPF0337 family)
MDTDRIEGKAKELEGKLTDDESREAEGRLQQKGQDLEDKPKEMWEDLKDKAGEAFNEREEEREREAARER